MGKDTTGGCQSIVKEVAVLPSSKRLWGADGTPATATFGPAVFVALIVNMEEGKDVPHSLTDITKKLYSESLIRSFKTIKGFEALTVWNWQSVLVWW